MSKVGRFVTDPRAGSYCQITLDSGEKIVVNHDKGGFKGGRITIERFKFMGFGSERLYVCELDTDHGRATLASLTHGAREGAVEATPLGAFVESVKGCASVEAVKAWCARQEPPRGSA